jgi:hypothetical protein
MVAPVTDGRPAGASDEGGRADAGASVPGWRDAFDAVERPIAALSDAWMRSDAYMDVLAVGWKLQRRVGRELRRGAGRWLGLWDIPTRGDVDRVVNQVASLERQVRGLARELERSTAGGPHRPARAAARGRTARRGP